MKSGVAKNRHVHVISEDYACSIHWFDSAWGTRNTGAICELVLQDDGGLLLQKGQPVSASWNTAIDRAGRKADGAVDTWAIDQPICVANESGCRPVESGLARAVMADFDCGAHSSDGSVLDS